MTALPPAQRVVRRRSTRARIPPKLLACVPLQSAVRVLGSSAASLARPFLSPLPQRRQPLVDAKGPRVNAAAPSHSAAARAPPPPLPRCAHLARVLPPPPYPTSPQRARGCPTEAADKEEWAPRTTTVHTRCVHAPTRPKPYVPCGHARAAASALATRLGHDCRPPARRRG